jgi:hypothetical protein
MPSKAFEPDQCETSDSENGPWRELSPDGATLRWVRIKPAEWEKWQREHLGLETVTVEITAPSDHTAP